MKKVLLIITIIFLFLAIPVSANNNYKVVFDKVIEEGVSYSGIATSDGGYLIVVVSISDNKTFITKYESNGEKAWQRQMDNYNEFPALAEVDKKYYVIYSDQIIIIDYNNANINTKDANFTIDQENRFIKCININENIYCVDKNSLNKITSDGEISKSIEFDNVSSPLFLYSNDEKLGVIYTDNNINNNKLNKYIIYDENLQEVSTKEINRNDYFIPLGQFENGEFLSYKLDNTNTNKRLYYYVLNSNFQTQDDKELLLYENNDLFIQATVYKYVVFRENIRNNVVSRIHNNISEDGTKVSLEYKKYNSNLEELVSVPITDLDKIGNGEEFILQNTLFLNNGDDIVFYATMDGDKFIGHQVKIATDYEVKIVSEDKNISFEKEHYFAGETVKILFGDKKEEDVEKVTVTDEEDNNIPVSEEYTFIMPESDVTVDVQWRKASISEVLENPKTGLLLGLIISIISGVLVYYSAYNYQKIKYKIN